MIKNCSNCGAGVTAAPEYNKASACETPPTQLRTVTIPKNKGGDGANEPYAPKLGAWQNTIVIYAKTKSVYLYDVNGIYTDLTGTDYATTILNMQEQLAKQQTSLDTLSSELAAETTSRTQGDAKLQGQIDGLTSGLAAETSAREAGDSSLSQQLISVQTQVNQIGTDVSNQGDTLAEAVKDLQENINQEANTRALADTELQANINKNANDIAALQTSVGDETGAVTKDVVYNVDASAGASTVNLVLTHGVLNTNDRLEAQVPLPVVSEAQAGVLNADTYISLQQNSENIDALLNGAVAVNDLPATPTQDQLSEAWKEATGKTGLVNRASILDTANNKVWYYYSNIDQWKDLPTGEAEVSVSLATNTAPGIVQGSTTDGQVAVEANGTMSLNGWDAYTAKVDNNTVQIAALQATIGTIQSLLIDLNTGAGV